MYFRIYHLNALRKYQYATHNLVKPRQGCYFGPPWIFVTLNLKVSEEVVTTQILHIKIAGKIVTDNIWDLKDAWEVVTA